MNRKDLYISRHIQQRLLQRSFVWEKFLENDNTVDTAKFIGNFFISSWFI
jgi:hypothetical protein